MVQQPTRRRDDVSNLTFVQSDLGRYQGTHVALRLLYRTGLQCPEGYLSSRDARCACLCKERIAWLANAAPNREQAIDFTDTISTTLLELLRSLFGIHCSNLRAARTH